MTIAGGTPFIVNTSTQEANSYAPIVEALSDGGFAVAWEAVAVANYPESTVRVRTFAADGTPKGNEVVVLPPPAPAPEANFLSGPDIAAMAGGGFLLGWSMMERRVLDGGFEFFYRNNGRFFDANGQPVGAAIPLSETDDQVQSAADLVERPDGGFVAVRVAMDDDAFDFDLRAQILGADGTALGDEFTVNSQTEGDQSEFDVAVHPDGDILTIWRSTSYETVGEEIRGRFIDPESGALGEEFVLDRLDGYNQYYRNPDLAILANGGFAAVWDERTVDSDGYSTGDVRMRVFGPDGAPAGAEVLSLGPNDGYPSDPAITALADGRFLAAWESGNHIRARIVTADGKAQGEELALKRVLGFQPAVEALDDGRFVASWGTSPDPFDPLTIYLIEAQIFDPTTYFGTPGADLWTGGSLVDTLRGGAGADRFDGAAGDDRIWGDEGRDRLHGGAGDDILKGGWGNDRMWGEAGTDLLHGEGGHDQFAGGVGDDRLYGGEGNDRLWGEAGRDRLEGGGGADRFMYSGLSDSRPADAQRDTIADFDAGEGDRIDLSVIDADATQAGNQAFTFAGQRAFTSSGGAGQLRFEVTGTGTYVVADVHGDRAPDFAIRLAEAVTLEAADFVL